MTVRNFDVVVVGGGVIGLSVAWRAAGQGWSVAVCDPAPGQGASWAAAGMIAPSTEARWGEEALHALSQASAAGWPEFAGELESETGASVGLSAEGTLSVAFDHDDYSALGEFVEVQRQLGCEAKLLSARELRNAEPSLSPRVAGGAFQPGDHHVDNRAVVEALLSAGAKRGTELLRERVRQLSRNAAGEVTGVLVEDGSALGAGAVVLAAGAWSAGLAGLSEADVPPVRPVKGQILRLRAAASSGGAAPALPRYTLRALSQGRSVYLVPKKNGELVVGATVEEKGFDTAVTAGAVHDLLRSAATVAPDTVEMELAEAVARLRPGSPDNGPILGPAPSRGLFVATGHFRHGFLLAPVTAAAVVEALSGRPLPGPARAFAASRFTARGPGAGTRLAEEQAHG